MDRRIATGMCAVAAIALGASGCGRPAADPVQAEPAQGHAEPGEQAASATRSAAGTDEGPADQDLQAWMHANRQAMSRGLERFVQSQVESLAPVLAIALFRQTEGRWPRDIDELEAFAVRRGSDPKDITEGGRYHELTWQEQPDGSCVVTYRWEPPHPAGRDLFRNMTMSGDLELDGEFATGLAVDMQEGRVRAVIEPRPAVQTQGTGTE